MTRRNSDQRTKLDGTRGAAAPGLVDSTAQHAGQIDALRVQHFKDEGAIVERDRILKMIEQHVSEFASRESEVDRRVAAALVEIQTEIKAPRRTISS